MMIKLTCSQGEYPDDINALELGQYSDGIAKAGREAEIDRSEAAEFIADCQGWNDLTDSGRTQAENFSQGYGIVVSMAADRWAYWLEGYAIVENMDPNYVSAYIEAKSSIVA